MFGYINVERREPPARSNVMDAGDHIIGEGGLVNEQAVDEFVTVLQQVTRLPVRIAVQDRGTVEVTVALPPDDERWNPEHDEGFIRRDEDGETRWHPSEDLPR